MIRRLARALRRWGSGGARPRPALGDPRPARLPRARAAEGRPALPALATLRDVQVRPADGPHRVARHRPGGTFAGGPVWPPGLEDSPLRFRSRGRILDRMAAPEARCDAVIDRPAVWGGFLQYHFGHMIAEHAGRFLWSRYARPDDLVLVSADPRDGLGDLPDWVLQVIGWYGIAPDRLHLVREPTLVRQLSVAPQAEPLGEGPSPEYLDLLDHHAAGLGLGTDPSGAVFVGRPGLIGRGLGGHLGEGYLSGLLEAAGVRVIDPLRLSVREQAEAYAGARLLIFAEGSAAHGRQLLGRIDQDIVVLNRRARASFAARSLRPRCRSLAYIEAGPIVSPVARAGHVMEATALTRYDVPRLLAGLARAGIDLAGRWDDRAYGEACRADAADWEAAVRSKPRTYDVPASLAALGREAAA